MPDTHTFVSDPNTVIAFAKRYMDGDRENGVAVSIKPFPGDGVDERDQHILTSVNDLSVEEWDATYGKVYQALIDEGAETVMVGHIAQPSYVRAINPGASAEEQLRLGSLSKEIMTGLLRDKLGFNGVISTDSTPMVGFTTAMERRNGVLQFPQPQEKFSRHLPQKRAAPAGGAVIGYIPWFSSGTGKSA